MDLTKVLPFYYDQNVTMQTLQGVLSQETDQMEKALNDSVSECFPTTALVLLSRYEKIFDLQVDASKSPGFRRERIKAKIAGIGTATKEMIKQVARSYSNGEVDVIEDNEHSCFTIRFIGTLGIPGNMAGLKLTIEEIKPAHLAVDYEYLYNTWKNMEVATWNSVAAYTWEGVRTAKL